MNEMQRFWSFSKSLSNPIWDLISLPWSFRCSCSEPYGDCWRKSDSCALTISHVFTKDGSYNHEGCAYIFSEPECGTCENGYTIVGVGETIIRKYISTAVLLVEKVCNFVSAPQTTESGSTYQYVAKTGSYDAETSPVINDTRISWTCVCGRPPFDVILSNVSTRILSPIIFNETVSTTDSTTDDGNTTTKGDILTVNPDSDSKPVIILVGGVIGTILFVSTLVMVIMVYRVNKTNQEKYKTETEKAKEIIESTRRQTIKTFENEYPLLVPFFNFRWNQEFGNWIPSLKHYEIARHSFGFDEEDFPIKGRFGKVYKGTMTKEDGFQVQVAVKTDSRGRYYKRSLLYEMVVLSTLGKHPNIVNFLGACTSNIYNDELFLLLEYCTNGSLRTYLIVHREKFENFIRGNDAIHPPPGKDVDKLLEHESLNTVHLIKWAMQIAKGLVHLYEKKILHNDLAARNILLDDVRNAKIGDYGLSRSLEEPSPIGYKKSTVSNIQYIKEFEEPLPPLLAPESRARNEFSFQTDVWSFGNLLYEIFTLGDDPMRSYDVNHRPRWSTGRIHEQINGCLQSDPTQRPVIQDLSQFFEKELSELRKNNLQKEISMIKQEDEPRDALTNEITIRIISTNITSDEIIPFAPALELNDVGYVISQPVEASIIYLPNNVHKIGLEDSELER